MISSNHSTETKAVTRLNKIQQHCYGCRYPVFSDYALELYVQMRLISNSGFRSAGIFFFILFSMYSISVHIIFFVADFMFPFVHREQSLTACTYELEVAVV